MSNVISINKKVIEKLESDLGILKKIEEDKWSSEGKYKIVLEDRYGFKKIQHGTGVPMRDITVAGMTKTSLFSMSDSAEASVTQDNKRRFEFVKYDKVEKVAFYREF